MNTRKKTSQNLCLLGVFFCLSFKAHTAPLASDATYQEQIKIVEKIKVIEKRFVKSITENKPDDYDNQRQLLKESFDLFYKAADFAEKNPSEVLISSVVKLGNILIDNDLSEAVSDRLYKLYKTQPSLSASAIAQLDNVSSKKVKSALKARQAIYDKNTKSKQVGAGT